MGFTPAIISLFLGCLASCSFTTVTSLVFKMVDILGFEVSDPDFLSFIASIPNVEVLQSGGKTIALLNGLADEEIPHSSSSSIPAPSSRVALPCLKTVKIQELDQIPDNFEGIITDFFKWRKGTGVWIELMVYGYVAPRAPDLTFLEDLVPGLEVVWRSSGPMMRYICGDGEPHELVYSASNSV
jgi:hypothetical protein